MAGSLADVLSSVQTQNAALAAGQGQMSDIFQQISGQADAIAAAAQQSGTDKAAIVQQAKQGELDAQTATRAVAASYGGNPDDVSFIMDKLGQQVLESQQARSAALATIQQKNSVSILDDPLTWLTNKLTINDDINKYNSADAEYEDAVKGIQNINTLNTTTAQGQLAIAKTQTVATVAAAADQAKQDANIEVAKSKLQGLLYNAQGLEKTLTLGQNQLNNAMDAQRAVIASGQLANAQAGLALQRQEFGLRSQMWQESLAQKAKADATDAQMVNWYNQGAAALGQKPIDSNKILAMAKAGGSVSQTVQALIVSGMQSDSMGKSIIAPTPGQAAMVMLHSNSPLATVNPAVKPVVDLLDNTMRGVQNPTLAAQLGVDKNKPDTIVSAVNSQLKPVLDRMSSNIRVDDTSNIYQAPDMVTLGKSAAVQQTVFYQKVLQPLIAAGGLNTTNPNQIMSFASDAMNKGTISMNDAVNGISTLFNAAAAINNQTKDYTRFGLPPQSLYRTQIDYTSTFGGSSVVDLTNKAAVTNAFAKVLSNNNRAKFDMQFMSGGL